MRRFEWSINDSTWWVLKIQKSSSSKTRFFSSYIDVFLAVSQCLTCWFQKIHQVQDELKGIRQRNVEKLMEETSKKTHLSQVLLVVFYPSVILFLQDCALIIVIRSFLIDLKPMHHINESLITYPTTFVRMCTHFLTFPILLLLLSSSVIARFLYFLSLSFHVNCTLHIEKPFGIHWDLRKNQIGTFSMPLFVHLYGAVD